MRPYFEDASSTIYHGDCCAVLEALASVASMITDPPYSTHVHAYSMRGARRTRGPIAKRRDFGFSALSEETMSAVAGWAGKNVLRWSAVFSDVESSYLWRAAFESNGLEYIRTGAWVKTNGAPQFSGDRPASGFETVTLVHPPGRKRWNGGGKPAVWTTPIVSSRGTRSEKRTHTAQKPLSLMLALVHLFSDPGEVIIDPFMGSGTTLRAAKELGRKAIGIELEERYCEIAALRLAQGVLPLDR
jgi:DNA modification methylase